MTLKVLNLKAENFKRIKAIDITPDGDMVFVGGKNAQGKTSVLDAIWAALAGGEAARAIKKPIRDGESFAEVTLDLGEYIVKRRWTKDDAGTLTVTAPSGAKFSSPQKMLDEIIGARAFDPLAFTRLPAKDQVTSLLGLVDLEVDLDELAAKRKGLFDQRTEIGRQGKALGEAPPLYEGVPDEEQSAADLVARIREAQDTARSNAALEAESLAATARVAQLEQELAEAQATASGLSNREIQPHEDPEKLEADLAAVEDTNQKVRHNQAARQTDKQRDALRTTYDTLTASIETLDKQKVNALAAAEFPVPGLSFGDDGVTLKGVPFSQASAAEQLKVSTALAIAANPSLRVLRILDGSLLDSDSLKIIADMAKDNDYQVWVEVVDETGEIGFVIEDGEVRE